MKWYVPSWNGDFRLEPDKKDSATTRLVIAKPTPGELQTLRQFVATCIERGWMPSGTAVSYSWMKKRVEIKASMEAVGPVLVSLMKPGPAVLTAVKYADGKLETSSGGIAELTKLAEEIEKKPEEKKPKAAATVSRPTPCCPDCIPGSVEMASEVLLAFLSPEEHEQWAKTRTIEIVGGLSGHRYRLAHRHTKVAEEQTRICYDLTEGFTVHFHDWSVPPEEEVLAAKLILEHREPWLRNEATCFFGPRDDVFKNPFGGGGDGTADASFTRQLGRILSGGQLS